MKQIFLAIFIIVCFCSVGSVGFSSSNSSLSSAYEMAEIWEEYRGIEFEPGIQRTPGITRIYVLVNTDDAPVEILAFGKVHVEPWDCFSGEVEYENRTDRDIEALAITMVCYDVFNDQQGFDRGVDVFPTPLKPGEEGSIYLAVAGESSIIKTAVAFISAVRFLDGEVWEVDILAVYRGVVRIARNIPELSFLEFVGIWGYNL